MIKVATEFRPLAYLVRGRYYAVPVDSTFDPESDYDIPDDFIALDAEFDDAMRVLAVRFHRDEW